MSYYDHLYLILWVSYKTTRFKSPKLGGEVSAQFSSLHLDNNSEMKFAGVIADRAQKFNLPMSKNDK